MNKLNENKIFFNAANVLEALGHPVRLKILSLLISNDYYVAELWKEVGVPQATVAFHLEKLKKSGVVKGIRKANRIYYQVTSEEAREIISFFFNGKNS